jgi:hypothetical protein
LSEILKAPAAPALDLPQSLTASEVKEKALLRVNTPREIVPPPTAPAGQPPMEPAAASERLAGEIPVPSPVSELPATLSVKELSEHSRELTYTHGPVHITGEIKGDEK